MRDAPLVNDHIYHIYNRGVDRRDIFSSDEDRRRFLRACIVFNDVAVYQRKIELIPDGVHPESSASPLVAIIAYALMDNHIHFLLQQKEENGIAKFMQRLGTGYTKYFNHRYDRRGSLFESTYKSVLIEDDAQFLHTTRYIHLNPIDLYSEESDRWSELLDYRWSSLRHYAGRTVDPVIEDTFLKTMLSTQEYVSFVQDWIPLRITKLSLVMK